MNKFISLGYIETEIENISFLNVSSDFNKVFSKKNTTKYEILQVIKKYIPEFNHIETGKKLDDKM